MKDKELKKLLSQSAADILPDDRVKENVKRELGAGAGEGTAVYAHGGVKTSGKKLWIIAVALAAALVLALAILLPLLSGRSRLPVVDNDKFKDIVSVDDFYAYGAASVGAIITANESGPVAARSAAHATFARESLSAQDKATVDRYLSLVDSLLSDGKIEHTERQAESGEYAYVMTVCHTDLLGNKIYYEMQYNREYIGGKTEDDEREEQYAIEGMLIIGDERYDVYGSLETEEEEDEREQKLNFRAYTSHDGYIEVEQESEEEEDERENSYVYTVVQNGRRVERTKVEYEEEADKLKVKMKVEKENGDCDELVFQDETKHGQRVLRVQASINGESIEFSVRVVQGSDGSAEYVYEFK